MDNRKNSRKVSSGTQKRVLQKRNEAGVDASLPLFPYVKDDNLRKQIMAGLSETSKAFLYQPNNGVFDTYVAHHKSQFCSPLQNLQLLQNYGFVFKQEFYCLRNALAEKFPDHKYRIVISARLNGELFNCQGNHFSNCQSVLPEITGEGHSDFVVLANEVAAEEVCQKMEAELKTKLAPYCIAKVLLVRPGSVQSLQQHCKDLLRSPVFDHNIVEDNPPQQKYECHVKVGLNSIKATAYHTDIAMFLASTMMLKKLSDYVSEVDIINSELKLKEEEGSGPKYVLIIERVMDLHNIPSPNKNLVPKYFEDNIRRRLNQYFYPEEAQVARSGDVEIKNDRVGIQAHNNFGHAARLLEESPFWNFRDTTALSMLISDQGGNVGHEVFQLEEKVEANSSEARRADEEIRSKEEHKIMEEQKFPEDVNNGRGSGAGDSTMSLSPVETTKSVDEEEEFENLIEDVATPSEAAIAENSGKLQDLEDTNGNDADTSSSDDDLPTAPEESETLQNSAKQIYEAFEDGSKEGKKLEEVKKCDKFWWLMGGLLMVYFIVVHGFFLWKWLS